MDLHRPALFLCKIQKDTEHAMALRGCDLEKTVKRRIILLNQIVTRGHLEITLIIKQEGNQTVAVFLFSSTTLLFFP